MTEQIPQKNTIHDDKGLRVFGKLSKYIILFPLIAIVVLIFMKVSSGSFGRSESTQMRTPTPLPVKKTFTPITKVNETKNASASAKLDLKGPLVCSYSDEKATVDVFIKDSQIYAEMPNKGEKERLLITGDCLYNWDEGETTGKKMCGVGQYIKLIETFSKLGVIDMDTIFGQITELQPSISVPDSKQLAKSCMREEIEDEVFAIPQNIEFKEEALKVPTP